MSKLNEIGQSIVVGFAAIGTCISSFLGGWDLLLKALVVFIVVDYVTGVICAIVEHKLNSKIGFKGIAKKFLILAIVGLAFMLDKAVGTNVLRNMAILFYIANEGISILENSTKIGVPYPQKLKDILDQLKKENENEKQEE